MKNDTLNVGLLSHYFEDDNLGCVALSICNIILIDAAAEKANIPIKYTIYVNEKQTRMDLPFTNNKYEYRTYSSCKQSLRHPLKLISTKIFSDCDIVFNLCAGDGFTDIYGFGRVLSESYMTNLSKMKGCKVVLAPQTIGPFSSKLNRAIAKFTMKNCSAIFTRDVQSTNFCKEVNYKGELSEVIDVAFALPFTKVNKEDQRNNIGINVSGLLYNGGYNHDNYFGLSFSYREYIDKLIEKLLVNEKSVHLISHVTTKDDSVEDDFVVCNELHNKFQQTILMPKKNSPIEVKNYIAGMDLFIGARMHSTIAAFSSGVPVIPVAYSRKVNGLYSTLEYPYYIDAKGNYTVDSAVNKTLEYIEKRNELMQCLNRSETIYKSRLEKYVNEVEKLLEDTIRLCQ